MRQLFKCVQWDSRTSALCLIKSIKKNKKKSRTKTCTFVAIYSERFYSRPDPEPVCSRFCCCSWETMKLFNLINIQATSILEAFVCVCVRSFQHKVTPLWLVLCCSKRNQVCSSAAVQQKKHCLRKHRGGISYYNGRNITKCPLDLGKSDCCGFRMTLTELQNAFSPQMMVSRLVSCLSLAAC